MLRDFKEFKTYVASSPHIPPQGSVVFRALRNPPRHKQQLGKSCPAHPEKVKRPLPAWSAQSAVQAAESFLAFIQTNTSSPSSKVLPRSCPQSGRNPEDAHGVWASVHKDSPPHGLCTKRGAVDRLQAPGHSILRPCQTQPCGLPGCRAAAKPGPEPSHTA